MIPYHGIAKESWIDKTQELVNEHPLTKEDIVHIVLSSWNAIFQSKIGDLTIGKDIFPTPQVMGVFLHELIPHELSKKYPTIWRKDKKKKDKDIVCRTDSRFSIEIKTSSHKSSIFGNRSYAQQVSGSSKSKTGYYLAVNFASFDHSDLAKRPQIKIIRFGWLEHTDWIAQKSPTGQQARLSSDAYTYKLLILYKS